MANIDPWTGQKREKATSSESAVFPVLRAVTGGILLFTAWCVKHEAEEETEVNNAHYIDENGDQYWVDRKGHGMSNGPGCGRL